MSRRLMKHRGWPVTLYLLGIGGSVLTAGSLTWAQGAAPLPPSCEEQRVYWQNYVGYLGEQRKQLEAELISLRGNNAWLQSHVTKLNKTIDERASTEERAKEK